MSRLSTDLANERTLLAWMRTALAVLRTALAIAFLGISAGGWFWWGSVMLAKLSMVTAIFAAAYVGIQRYTRIRRITFLAYPPKHWGRLSVSWFNYLIILAAVVMMAGLYLDMVVKDKKGPDPTSVYIVTAPKEK